ncbi:unnamed protein product [Closterium sp. NIES-54]
MSSPRRSQPVLPSVKALVTRGSDSLARPSSLGSPPPLPRLTSSSPPLLPHLFLPTSSSPPLPPHLFIPALFLFPCPHSPCSAPLLLHFPPLSISSPAPLSSSRSPSCPILYETVLPFFHPPCPMPQLPSPMPHGPCPNSHPPCRISHVKSPQASHWRQHTQGGECHRLALQLQGAPAVLDAPYPCLMPLTDAPCIPSGFRQAAARAGGGVFSPGSSFFLILHSPYPFPFSPLPVLLLRRPIGGSISKGGSALAWRCSCREHQLCWTCPSPSCTSPSSRCDTVQCGAAHNHFHFTLFMLHFSHCNLLVSPSSFPIGIARACHVPVMCLSCACHVPVMCLSCAYHVPVMCLSYACHVPMHVHCMWSACHVQLGGAGGAGTSHCVLLPLIQRACQVHMVRKAPFPSFYRPPTLPPSPPTLSTLPACALHAGCRWSNGDTPCAPSSHPSTCMPAVPTLPLYVKLLPTLSTLSHSSPPSPTLSLLVRVSSPLRSHLSLSSDHFLPSPPLLLAKLIISAKSYLLPHLSSPTPPFRLLFRSSDIIPVSSSA